MRLWRPAAVLAVGGYLAVVYYVAILPDAISEAEPWVTLMRGVRSAHMWGAILALLALAHLKLNRDTPARRYLTEAVFPYYIAHQTIIVLVGHGLKPYALSSATEFVVILVVTVVGCAITYEVARRMPSTGVLLGLRWQSSHRLSLRRA